jgi:hypothetical protein
MKESGLGSMGLVIILTSSRIGIIKQLGKREPVVLLNEIGTSLLKQFDGWKYG